MAEHKEEVEVSRPRLQWTGDSGAGHPTFTNTTGGNVFNRQ
jgi:hypothetical protein